MIYVIIILSVMVLLEALFIIIIWRLYKSSDEMNGELARRLLKTSLDNNKLRDGNYKLKNKEQL